LGLIIEGWENLGEKSGEKMVGSGVFSLGPPKINLTKLGRK